MKALLACLAAATTTLLGSAAYPCGASFGSNIKVDPHQDIIVAWKDGVETYAFQPTFCGSSTDFGLILPIPGKLAQNPALIEQQAFIKAAAVSEPNKRQVVVHHGGGCGAASDGAGGKSQGIDEPTVVASGRVGMLDWSELKAETESSFTSWLDANGYPYSPASSTVFSYYVQKGSATHSPRGSGHAHEGTAQEVSQPVSHADPVAQRSFVGRRRL